MSDAIREWLARKLEEVEAERDALGRLVHDKSVLLQRAEAERDALAAHVERWAEWLGRDPEDDIGDWMDEGWNLAKETPETSLARRDLLKQAEALEKIAYDFDAQGECVGYGLQCREAAAELRRQAEEAK